ncbi:MAG: hypothetical protein RI531_09835, partial [Haloferacaceae archaeon]|nr:hypothetical protein [Haloferacaceae archaeon]
ATPTAASRKTARSSRIPGIYERSRFICLCLVPPFKDNLVKKATVGTQYAKRAHLLVDGRVAATVTAGAAAVSAVISS